MIRCDEPPRVTSWTALRRRNVNVVSSTLDVMRFRRQTPRPWLCSRFSTANTRSPASILALARAAGGARDSSVDRPGLRVQRVQLAAVAAHWRNAARRPETGSSARSAGYSASRSCFSDCRPRCSGLARARRSAKGDVRRRRCASAADLRSRRLASPRTSSGFCCSATACSAASGSGIGYISPVTTLIRWFPDRPGMATGMAIMGFGGGAMIASPLSTMLMAHFKTDTGARRRRRRS